MLKEHDYFVIQKEIDFPDELEYYSPAFDSLTAGNIWHRAVIRSDARILVSFAAAEPGGNCREASEKEYWAEESEAGCREKPWECREKPWECREKPWECREKPWECWEKPWECRGSLDIPLHRYRGRFLKVRVQCDDSCRKAEIRLYYQAHTFNRYLPEVYRQPGWDHFFVRFTALFQSVYLDMEETIRDIPRQLDSMTVDTRLLGQLAEFIGCTEYRYLPENRGREYLLKTMSCYRIKGTASGIREIVSWLTGEKPVIIEYGQIREYLPDAVLERHYGGGPFTFTIILPGTDSVYQTVPAAAALLREMKPAGTVCRLVVLEQRIRLDCYVYLGINSMMADYEQLLLDERRKLMELIIN